MLKPTCSLLAALVLLSAVPLPTAVLAQSQPDVGSPVVPNKPPLIDGATQQKIRDYVLKQMPPPAEVELKVGGPVPDTVKLYSLPEDSVTELPTITAYGFVPVGNQIAIVDPEKRTVVQLIDK